MTNRFTGEAGKTTLLLALRSQFIVRDNEDIATALADSITLLEYPTGSIIIVQDASDSDLHFILSGRVVIQVNTRDIAFRGAGTHIGDMAKLFLEINDTQKLVNTTDLPKSLV